MNTSFEGGSATWLELAVAPVWRLRRAQIRVHAIEGHTRGGHTITLDGRWLCANDGRLTVFDSENAAIRFLELMHVEHVEVSDAVEVPAAFRARTQCLEMGEGGLHVAEPPLQPAPSRDPSLALRIVIPAAARRPTLHQDFILRT
ncbi:MAG: hypothetical protein HGA47_06370 [Zoogloea sp.]|nr:hypothetical protein [Zoogloea sp.]